MDQYGWFIATLHSLLGHDTLARFLGQPTGDHRLCVLCQYEDHPTSANKARVVAALSPDDDQEN